MNWRVGQKVLVACVGVFMLSCLSDHTATVVDTPPIDWNEAVEMAFANRDTTSQVDLSLVIFYALEAPDSVDLAVRTTSPDGYVAEDTVRCYLPRRKSQHDYYEREVLFRRGTMLRCSGNYNITFAPTTTTRGVWAVGLNTKLHNEE